MAASARTVWCGILGAAGGVAVGATCGVGVLSRAS